MKNPGKFLTVLMVMAATAWASLSMSVDSRKVVLGDSVTLTLSASGSDVQKPNMLEVCGEKIVSTSQGTNIQVINGQFSKAYTFAYVFVPKKDCTITPVTLKIDGKEETTKAIDIRVVPMSITKDSPFILQMTSDKKTVYVGEPFKVTVTFKQRHDSDAVDSEFIAPEMKNFWIKGQAKGRSFEEGEYTVTHLTYIMAAQQVGEQSVDPVQLKIASRSASRDAWGQWLPLLKWRTYYSNAVEVKVLPLPEGVRLTGDFTIEATADKTELEANEAVNVTLRISGSGNFEDIGSQKPSIPGVAVYDEEGVTNAAITRGEYVGSWTQKMAFVSDSSFTIPPFTLRFFDVKTKAVVSIKTEAIPVMVKGGRSTEAEAPLKIQRSKVPESVVEAEPSGVEQSWELLFGLGTLAGVLLGMVLMLLPWRTWFSREGEKKRIDLNDYKRVLMLLLPHRDDPEVAEMVQRLEGNLYAQKSEKIDKKVLKALVKRVSVK